MADQSPAPMALTPPAAQLELAKPENQPQGLDLVDSDEGRRQASAMAPKATDEERAKARARAQADVGTMSGMNPAAPEFTAVLERIEHIGAGSLRSVGQSSKELLSMRTDKVRDTQETAKTLDDLSQMVDDLTPAKDLSVGGKIMRLMPGGHRLRRYFQRFQSNQTKLNKIELSLGRSKDRALRDNAQLEHEKANLWKVMIDLDRTDAYATELRKGIVALIGDLQARGETDLADAWNDKALFAVNQVEQNILTQLAVAVQSYAAMDQTVKSNKLLQAGVDQAINTTMAAFRTAMVVHQALFNQKLTLDKIANLRSATESTMRSTAELLHSNTVRLQEQASEPAVALDTLREVFGQLQTTLTEVRDFHARANGVIDGNIDVLRGYIDKAQTGLDAPAAR